MTDKPMLHGFDGSTYVRTTKMVLNDKGVDYDQNPVNVPEGETRQPEHLARHPFGKVPVLDIDGMRLRETDAICRYLEDTRPEPALIPVDPKARATMAEAINVIGSYGYDAILGVAGPHLFPDLVAPAYKDRPDKAMDDAKTCLNLLLDNAKGSDWLAGDAPTLADYFLGPLVFYVTITPEGDRFLADPRAKAWWERMSALESFKRTAPDL